MHYIHKIFLEILLVFFLPIYFPSICKVVLLRNIQGNMKGIGYILSSTLSTLNLVIWPRSHASNSLPKHQRNLTLLLKQYPLMSHEKRCSYNRVQHEKNHNFSMSSTSIYNPPCLGWTENHMPLREKINEDPSKKRYWVA